MPFLRAQIMHAVYWYIAGIFRKHEVYWYTGPPKWGILVWNRNLDSKHEVYWYIWPNFGKVRYFGMKPYYIVLLVEMVSKPHSSSNLPSKYRKCWEIVKFCDTYYAATTRIPTMWFTSNPHSSSRLVTYLVSILFPSTRCAHHACTNLRKNSFNSNIHALRVFSRMYLMDTSRCRMVWAFNCTGTGTEIFC